MTLRLPPLAALRLFEAAARRQSFKLAADELGLTPSAVSHGIVNLEKWLEVELFERGSRKVTLTAAGRQFLPYVSEGLSMIALGAQRIPGRRTERRVTVSVATTFAVRWLVPSLHKFRKLHPRIGISIDTSHRQALFPLDGVDLAIRMGKGPWPGTTSDLLMRERLVPIAAPDYLRQVSRDGGLDWSKVTLLHVTPVEYDWDAWLAGAGLPPLELRTGLHFDTVQLAVAAAAEGLGIAIGREPLITSDLVGGRLVRASDITVPIATGYWVVGPAGEETRSEIKAFRNWVIAEFRQKEPDLALPAGNGRPGAASPGMPEANRAQAAPDHHPVPDR